MMRYVYLELLVCMCVYVYLYIYIYNYTTNKYKKESSNYTHLPTCDSICTSTDSPVA